MALACRLLCKGAPPSCTVCTLEVWKDDTGSGEGVGPSGTEGTGSGDAEGEGDAIGEALRNSDEADAAEEVDKGTTSSSELLWLLLLLWLAVACIEERFSREEDVDRDCEGSGEGTGCAGGAVSEGTSRFDMAAPFAGLDPCDAGPSALGAARKGEEAGVTMTETCFRCGAERGDPMGLALPAPRWSPLAPAVPASAPACVCGCA